MRLLLDTHVLLWWLEGSRKLGGRARTAIEAQAAMVDRVLIAQARQDGLTILTSDTTFEAYGVRLLDART